MKQAAAFIATMLLLAGMAPHADQSRSGIPDLYQGQRAHWESFDVQISPEEYRQTTHRNKRVISATARAFLEDTLSSFGVPERGAQLTGAAIGLAVKGAKLDLNKSKTMALELDDVVTHDRALFFKVRLDW